MTRIMITVLSDDIEKSKKFAKYLAWETPFKVELETKDNLILNHNYTTIRAIDSSGTHRAYRHNKIYVDSESPKAVELTFEMYYAKILPLYSPISRYRLEVNNPIELIDFDKLMKFE